MRFSSIEINNYRQYKNVKFCFDKTSENDMHIIVASNGVGKTNLLNAINWCLYGDEPHASGAVKLISNQKDKLSLCNIDAIEEAKINDEQYGYVVVKICMTEGNQKYVFERKASISVNTYLQAGKDIFNVLETRASGDTYRYEEAQADEIINRYLPKKIREYFYFDGEQLLNYFDPDISNVSHIRDSIYEIAQVNVIGKVEEHLGSFAKQYQKKLSRLSPNLEAKATALNVVQNNIDNKKREIAQIEEQIANSEKAIEQMDSIINGTERIVEYNNRYNKNKEEIVRYEAKLMQVKQELSIFVRKYLVKILLYKKNKNTEQYIMQKVGDGSLVPDINIDVIKNSLEEHKCKICGSDLNKSAEEYFQTLVQKFMSNVSIQKLTEIKNDIHRGLEVSEYQNDKERIFGLLKEYQDKIDDLNAENDKLYNQISTVSEIKEIEIAMMQKRNNEDLVKLNSQKKGSYKTQLENLEKEKTDKKKEYDQAIKDNSTCDDIKRHYDFVSDAREIIISIKNSIVTDVKSKMQKRTMEIFEELLWKKETYGRIELDDNFRLKLFHKRTNLSCLHSCSAAEKELLALAFTIGLHEVSGYDNLLFIDTPVGRVSDINRENFAKVLLNVSQSKQIILAVTPSEYSDEISNVLNQEVISSYNKLTTDEIATIREA
ncbi:AAA family ATPase [Clostridia bacterium]|nr:AAA family ATPase [Clostridia bacterium]